MTHCKQPLPDRYARLSMAQACFCDERTLIKALRGQKVQPTILAKIKDALTKRGEVHLLGVCE